MDHIGLLKYIVVKGHKTGRGRAQIPLPVAAVQLEFYGMRT